jgi:hypothetical protein
VAEDVANVNVTGFGVGLKRDYDVTLTRLFVVSDVFPRRVRPALNPGAIQVPP